MSSKRRAFTKLLAILLMTGNHFAHIFLPGSSPLAMLLTGLGYFTAPVMCMYLVDGYFYTHSRRGYLKRLLITALLSQLPFWLAFRIPFQLNMLFSLTFCLLLLTVAEEMKGNPYRKPLLALLFFVCTLFSDWSAFAPAMVLLFLAARGVREKKLYGFLFAMLGLSIDAVMTGFTLHEPLPLFCFRLFSVNAGPLLALLIAYPAEPAFTRPDPRAEAPQQKTPAGASSRAAGVSQWFFYLYYPLHLTVLVLLKQFVFV